MTEEVPNGVKFLYFMSEELRLSGRTHNPWSKQKKWNPTALLSAAPSGSRQGLWKAEGDQANCKYKKHMLRCDIKSKCLDLMRYSLLYSFPGIGCFPDKEKELDELLLCPSMDIFVYGKTQLLFHIPTTAWWWEFSEWEGTAGCILCIWRSNDPLAEVCVCLLVPGKQCYFPWLSLFSKSVSLCCSYPKSWSNQVWL